MAAVATDPELRELKAYLEKVAPEGEVLIGVSNKNPMLEGMLDTWLRGVRGAGVSGPGWGGRLGALGLCAGAGASARDACLGRGGRGGGGCTPVRVALGRQRVRGARS